MIRVAIAGCGSVSREYLEDLGMCRHARVVAVCDVDVRRAQARAEEFGISLAFGSLDQLLADCTFDLLVNLTAMPAHYAVNLAALRAGKHVMSEKPMASTFQEGTELVREADARGLSLFVAPSCCASPAFGALRDLVASGEIGQVYAAHARYGHAGPDWGPWFYGPKGGPIHDLAVYNVTFLTGLLGPVHTVTAHTTTACPHRTIEGMDVTVECEDNAAILMDHGKGCISCVQTGFVYGRCRDDWSVELIGTQGSAYLLGWDWEPHGVEVWTERYPRGHRRAEDQRGYHWRNCATLAVRSLANGRPEPALDPVRALHVLEIMERARESGRTGLRNALASADDGTARQPETDAP